MQRFIDSLELYEKHKIEPGSFLRAVLENDLFTAIGRADIESRVLLPELVSYIYNNVRHDCHGSKQRVRDWLFKETPDEG